jgi:hypothetical protein
VRVENQLFYDARDWNHLAVVYDGFAQQAMLYVNGQLQEISCTEESTAECVSGESWADNALTFRATASLQVGRSRAEGAWGQYWPGAIDDLWVFQGILTPSQVATLADGQPGFPTEVPTG